MFRNLLLYLSLAGCVMGAGVDRYGQDLSQNWEGKITQDAQLQADAEHESRILGGPLILEKLDAHGGVISAGTYRATGFFRLEKVDGRWWFITPEGHRFFLVGVDACDWNEGGYSTPLSENGKPRPELTELPDKNTFPDAYRRGGKVNFISSNLQIKYGKDFEKKMDGVMRRRLAAWGFNSTAKWGWGVKYQGVPYFEDADIKGALKCDPKYRYIDMYEPDFARKCDETARVVCQRRRGDPDLIAYACENENGWNFKAIDMMLDGTPALNHAKRACLEFLAERLDGINQVSRRAGFPEAGLDELCSKDLKPAMFPRHLLSEFILESSRKYHRILRDAYKRHDPDHMFMGGSHCSHQSGEWVRGSAEVLDFIGVHNYTMDLGWFKQHLPMMRELDKPFALLEFSFVTEDRGMRAYNGDNTCKDQDSRGLGYRYFTESIATNPLCLGFGYFIFWDQPCLGRSIGGESHNFGLVSQQDQPYWDVIEHVKLANAKLFALHDGKEKPFVLKDRNALLRDFELIDKLKKLFVSGTMSPCIAIDMSNAQFFQREPRMKLREYSGSTLPGEVTSTGPHWYGVVDWKDKAGGTLVIETYYWNKGKSLDQQLLVETKATENAPWNPLAKSIQVIWKGSDFTKYRIRVVPPTGTTLVRIGLDVDHPTKAWVLNLTDIRIEK